jgi:saccharopine dehydrogenase-like NADP-dependent oxidoreductase
MKNIPFMKEKTLRYPGHIRLIQALQAAGFFKETAVKVGNNEIKPIDFTNQLLFDQWKLEPDDDEFTIMRIVMEGILDDEHVEIVYDLLDEFDKGTGLSSMGRTTGFTATAAVSLIDEEIFTSKGVFPPEIVGKDENSFHFIMNYLRERNILYNKTVIKLD